MLGWHPGVLGRNQDVLRCWVLQCKSTPLDVLETNLDVLRHFENPEQSVWHCLGVLRHSLGVPRRSLKRVGAQWLEYVGARSGRT